MDQFVTGGMIRRLREEKNLTQAQLAEKLHVSDKAISKWKTGRGYPDITLMEPLAETLGVSVTELLSGCDIKNRNRSFNMKKLVFTVCPICGNILLSTGETAASCCGIPLLPLEAEEPDDEHRLSITEVEDEYYVTMEHEMSKKHYISFFAALSDNGVELVKLYPEGNAEARLKLRGTKYIYFYCNRHGLFGVRVNNRKQNIDRM